MNPFRLDRRAVLRGAGVAVALPWLEAMTGGTRRAHAATPKRFVAFFTPNGMVNSNSGNMDKWSPTGAGSDFTLSPILQALEPHRNDIVPLIGVDNLLGDASGPGDQHMKGMGTMLTGVLPAPGSTQGGGMSTPSGLAGGISIDQVMVSTLKPPTKFASLEMGVEPSVRGTIWDYMSYSAREKPLPAEGDPKKIFDRVFGQFSAADADKYKRLREDQKSVLDAAAENFTLVNKRLGMQDRIRLEGHLAAVRDLETRLFASAGAGSSCKKPASPVASGFQATGKAQMDLLAMILACDLTRISTLQWSKSVSGTVFSWLGATRGHHDMSHDAETNIETQDILTKINIWYTEQFAYLLGALKALPENGGTVLDNTLIFWCNEIARGNHSHNDMPHVLAGRGGGWLKTGRALRYTGRTYHNNLLVSLLNAMDVPVDTFGDKTVVSGPLKDLA